MWLPPEGNDDGRGDGDASLGIRRHQERQPGDDPDIDRNDQPNGQPIQQGPGEHHADVEQLIANDGNRERDRNEHRRQQQQDWTVASQHALGVEREDRQQRQDQPHQLASGSLVASDEAPHHRDYDKQIRGIATNPRDKDDRLRDLQPDGEDRVGLRGVAERGPV